MSRCPVLAVLGLIFVTPFNLLRSQEGFQITDLTITGEVIEVNFVYPSDLGGSFVLQQAVDLSGGWETASGVLEEVEPGQGRFTIDLAGRTGFFRVAAAGTGTLPRVRINEVMANNESVLESINGEFPDWVELYNYGDETVVLGELQLSDDRADLGRWTLPDVELGSDEYLLVFLSGENVREGPESHASFKLRNGQEPILLSSAGVVIDEFHPGPVANDGSFGRSIDDPEIWLPQEGGQATPGNDNTSFLFGKPDPYVEPPRFFTPGGVHEGSVTVVLSSPIEGDDIRYTINGEEPEHSLFSSNSNLYTEAIVLDKPTVIRAKIYGDAGRRSGTRTVTYLPNVNHTLPVVSLTGEPEKFAFRDGEFYGLGDHMFTGGDRIIGTFPYNASNVWKNVEIGLNFEFYETGSQEGINIRVGAKIFGGWGSRGYPQKSMALFARREYGYGRIRYPIFPGNDVDSFESIVLRNSGNDNQSTHLTVPRPPIDEFSRPESHGSYFVNGNYTLFRDALTTGLARETGLDTQAYQPAVVYINGDYWGIYNLREKLNEHYVASHHDVDPDKVDLIEGYGSANSGSGVVYSAMRSFVGGRDMNDPDNYAEAREKYVDTRNFIDYHFTVIYCQNFDIGNIKCWRPRENEDGQFRWMLYDQDYGFDLWPPEVYHNAMARDYSDYRNMFSFYTSTKGSGTGWPNNSGRTMLLREMLENDEFRRDFILRGCDLLNTLYSGPNVVARIDRLADGIRDEIPDHLARWSWAGIQERGFGHPHKEEDVPLTLAQWEHHVEIVREFARNRPDNLRADLLDHFQLEGGLATISIGHAASGKGRVEVSTAAPRTYPWSGRYCVDVSPEIRAVAAPGFVFEGWEGQAIGQPESFVPELATDGSFAFSPRFSAVAPGEGSEDVTVSELMYHPSADSPSGDWIEIVNGGATTVELADWALFDGNDAKRFEFPAHSLPPGGHVVLCEHPHKFSDVYGENVECLGPLGFSLSNGGEQIRLVDAAGALILDFRYEDSAPWPDRPDGQGPSLERTDFDVSPDTAGAWRASAGQGGSPGQP